MRDSLFLCFFPRRPELGCLRDSLKPLQASAVRSGEKASGAKRVLTFIFVSEVSRVRSGEIKLFVDFKV